MSTSARPTTPGLPPEGHQYVAVADPDWRLIGDSKRCRSGGGFRRRACGAPAVARLRRLTTTRHGSTYRWWAYCGEHLYGRWIEDGRVMSWVLREVPDA